MPDKRSYIYWDACCYCSYFKAERDRLPNIKAVIREAQSSGIRLLTATLSIVEVAFVGQEQTQKKLKDDTTATLDAFWMNDRLNVLVEPNMLVMRIARDLMRTSIEELGKTLKPSDAIHLASAVWVARNALVVEFQTYDERILECRPLVPFPICEPTPRQFALPIAES